MPVRRLLVALALLAIFPARGWADERAATAWQPQHDKPVRIFAEQMSVDHAGKTAIFRGSVILIQDDVRLRCSKALVRYDVPAGGQQGFVDRVECEQ